ncbi:MAG: Fe-S protein assembly co-chaperone HscB [Pseudomonadales bacterium]
MATSTEHAIACTLKPLLSDEQDYFSIFGLQPSWEVDVAQLAERYRQLQQAVHPDRFMRECDRSQRLAQQQAAQVNAAFNTLKSPLLRAQYLLEREGQAHAQERTVHDGAFLMAQIELRERLDDAAGDLSALDQLTADVQQQSRQYQHQFADYWQKKDWSAAQSAVDKLQFATKLLQEIENRQELLLDE